VLLRECPLFVPPPHRVWNNESGKYEFYYEERLDITMVKMIAKSLNMSLVPLPAQYLSNDDIKHYVGLEIIAGETLKSKADIVIGGLARLEFSVYPFEVSRGYFNIRMSLITPCAIAYPRWNRILKIFSLGPWLCIILFFVLAVITVNCISNYGHRLHLSEYRAYGNVTSITANMTSVALGVSVHTQPRTTPLRVFFVSCVCYSFGISTVFQAYLTSFIIDPAYEEPIKTTDEMLNSGMKFGVPLGLEEHFDSEFLMHTVFCPDSLTCFKWASKYQNISIFMFDMFKDILKSDSNWTDEYNRPLLCELEDGTFAVYDVGMAVLKGHPLLEHINDVINHVVEAGLPMQWKKLMLETVKLSSKPSFTYTLADTYVNISATHLQSAFYMLLLGYVLALLSFILEVIWYNVMSERSYLTHMSASHGALQTVS
jgi:hypothetical protein